MEFCSQEPDTHTHRQTNCSKKNITPPQFGGGVIIIEIRKMNHYKSVFQHIDVKSVLKLYKRYQIAVAIFTKKLSVKNCYFSNIVQFKWNFVFLLSFWPWRRMFKKLFENIYIWPVISVKANYFQILSNLNEINFSC